MGHPGNFRNNISIMFPHPRTIMLPQHDTHPSNAIHLVAAPSHVSSAGGVSVTVPAARPHSVVARYLIIK